MLLDITEEWQSYFPNPSDELELLKGSLLRGANTHSMQGYFDKSGLLNNAWRLHIEESAI